MADVEYKTVPWSVKQGVELHDSFESAESRAQKVANKTGDWVLIEQRRDGVLIFSRYIQPNAKGR